MKGFGFIGLLGCLFMLTACQRESILDDRPELALRLEFPASALTKADATEVPASAAETAIHDLKIWVFNSNDKSLVTSMELDASNLQDDFPQPGSVKRYSMKVSWDFAYLSPRPKVDVFVLANSASIGMESNREGGLRAKKVGNFNISTYEELEAANFGGTLFALDTKQTEVPDEGLPMSGVAKEMVISGEEPSLSIGKVSLVRAVSKIRFVFSQMKTEGAASEQETLRIDKIVLNGDRTGQDYEYKYPTSEYVFATPSAPRVGTQYSTSAVEFTQGPDNVALNQILIASSERPEFFSYRGQDGTTYESIIQEALNSQVPELTHCGTYYIRETDKNLSGTIYYSVIKGKGTSSETVIPKDPLPFTTSAEGDFSRNHTWTVYGYYISKRTMELSVNVMPWTKTDYVIDYSTSALIVTWKLSVMQQSVESIDPITGQKDHYTVHMKRNQPASAYLFVAAPQGGRLRVEPKGDTDAFRVSFGNTIPEEELRETTINPSLQNGRINITIDRNWDYPGSFAGKSITLQFKAYTPDKDPREIEGASECIDQIYHFTLPSSQ